MLTRQAALYDAGAKGKSPIFERESCQSSLVFGRRSWYNLGVQPPLFYFHSSHVSDVMSLSHAHPGCYII
jgi:hypothetical protein